MKSLKRFNEKKLSDKKCFYRLVKYGTTDENGKKLHCLISDEDYLTCNRIWK